MTDAFKQQIQAEARQAVEELLEQAKLKKGDVSLPMCPPTISLDEQPTTNTSPFFSFASASSSVTACRASCSICF